MERITKKCFKETTCWHDDLAVAMREKFGIQYDNATIRKNSNNKGNGFIEKTITRGVCNARADLYQANKRAGAEEKAPRIKRRGEEANRNGKYQRMSRSRPASEVEEASSPQRRLSPRKKTGVSYGDGSDLSSNNDDNDEEFLYTDSNERVSLFLPLLMTSRI
jgi:hypothetical protein